MRGDKIAHWYAPHERYVSLGAFFAGFVWDNLTLTSVELWLDNLVLLGYLILAGTSIFVLNARDSGHLNGRFAAKIAEFLPLAMQFAFGGLFSGLVVFYWRSSALIASWPFLLLLGVMFLGNEFFRKRYLRLTFQLSVFFIALYSYIVLIMPVIVGRMGIAIFLLSGLVSLACIGLIGILLYRVAPSRVALSYKLLFVIIGGIFFTFNGMYIANMIPPIPLALKDGGVYHLVERLPSGDYRVRYEPARWHTLFREESRTIHWTRGMPLFVYSAVFTPTRLNTTIIHRWSHYDETKGNWVERNKLGFPISGGRESGYRGYSVKHTITPGLWRVDVITERGVALGRITFTVVETEHQPELAEAVK